jgi:hypothetical protein
LSVYRCELSKKTRTVLIGFTSWPFWRICWRVTSPTISLALILFVRISRGSRFSQLRERERERERGEKRRKKTQKSKKVAFLMAIFLSSSSLPLPLLLSSNHCLLQTPPSLSLSFPFSYPLRATITANSRQIKTLILASSNSDSSFDGFGFNREPCSTDKVSSHL